MKNFLNHPKSQYWNKYNDINKENANTSDKYSFICDKCNHEFRATIYSVSKNHWCPYCEKVLLCDDNSCAQCFENSFASSNRAMEWNYEENDTSPRKVFKYSGKIFTFKCIECNHNYKTSVGLISYEKKNCPYCMNKLMCNDCDYCYKKTYAYTEFTKYWSDKNALKPKYVNRKSKDLYWFYCDKCKHEELLPLQFTHDWCNYCKKKKLCDDINCKFCFYNSCERIKEYINEASGIIPRKTLLKDNYKLIFNCKNHHVFAEYLHNIDFNNILCQNCKKRKRERFI